MKYSFPNSRKWTSGKFLKEWGSNPLSLSHLSIMYSFSPRMIQNGTIRYPALQQREREGGDREREEEIEKSEREKKGTQMEGKRRRIGSYLFFKLVIMVIGIDFRKSRLR